MLIFLIAFLLSSLLFLPCRHVLRKINMSNLNFVGGSVFGIARGLLYSIMLVLALSALGFRSSPAWAQSHTLPYIDTAIKVALAIPGIRQYRGYLQLDERGRLITNNTTDLPPLQPPPVAERQLKQYQQHHDELDELTEQLVRQSPAGHNRITELALQRYRNEQQQTSQQRIVAIFEGILCEAGAQSSCPPEDRE